MLDTKSVREQTVRDAKSTIILDSARNVFSDKGFHNTRLEDIATASGFSKASLYNYFKDKEEIFLSLAIRDFEELLIKLQVVSKDESFDIIKSLEYGFKTVFNFFGEQFAFFWETTKFQSSLCIDHEKIHGHHEEMLKIFKTNYDGIMSTFVMIIKRARERGQINSPIPDLAICEYISALVRGTIFEWKVKGKMGNVDDTVKGIIEFVLNGLSANKTLQA